MPLDKSKMAGMTSHIPSMTSLQRDIAININLTFRRYGSYIGGMGAIQAVSEQNQYILEESMSKTGGMAVFSLFVVYKF